MSIKTEELKKIEKEIEGKVEAHTNVSMKAYDKGIQQGKQSALKQFEDEVKEKVEKLKEVISNVMAVGDYSTWAGLEEQTLKEVDKIFGDEETSKEMGE